MNSASSKTQPALTCTPAPRKRGGGGVSEWVWRKGRNPPAPAAAAYSRGRTPPHQRVPLTGAPRPLPGADPSKEVETPPPPPLQPTRARDGRGPLEGGEEVVLHVEPPHPLVHPQPPQRRQPQRPVARGGGAPAGGHCTANSGTSASRARLKRFGRREPRRRGGTGRGPAHELSTLPMGGLSWDGPGTHPGGEPRCGGDRRQSAQRTRMGRAAVGLGRRVGGGGPEGEGVESREDGQLAHRS